MDQRTGPLTWGQYLPWVTQNAAPESNPYYKILTFQVVAPAGVDSESVLRAVDLLVAGHEGLRTRFEATGGTVRQAVLPVGGRFYRYSVSDSDEGAGWLTEPFDLAGEGTLRAALWPREDGRWVLRLAVHRMILDHEGMVVLRIELHRALAAFAAGTDATDPPAAAWEPIDIAEFEASPAGRRRDERAFEYWRRVLVTAPGSQFTTARPQRPTDSRFSIKMTRSALRPVVHELAADFRVTEPAILTAAVMLALSWVGEWPVVCATVISNNRSIREMRQSIAPMLDRSLVTVAPDPAQPFSAWAATVGAAMIGAYKHSHGDPNTLLRAYAEVSMERGIRLDRLPMINVMDDRVAAFARSGKGPLPAQADIPPVEPDEYKVDVQPSPLDGMYIRVRLLWRRLWIELFGGEEVYDQATAERIVAQIPAILEALGAHGDLTLGKLAEVALREGSASPGDKVEFVHIDHTRVDLAALMALLRESEGVTDCALFTGTEERDLVVCLAGDERLDDLYALRRGILGRLGNYRHVLCPQWFRVVRTAPAEPDSYDAWLAVPAVVEGSGWPAPPLHPAGAEEAALAEALAAAHPPMGTDEVDLGLPYCLAGGRFERIPAFLTELADRGIKGISVDDLMGTQPLVTLLAETVPSVE